MKLVYGHDENIAIWVGKQIDDVDRGFENCRAVGVVNDDGKLIAGFVYHNWQPETGVMEISAATTSPRWLTKAVLNEMFGWPFKSGNQLVVLRVAHDDYRLLRQLKAVNFKLYKIPRLRGRNEAEIICTLADDDWSKCKLSK